MHWSLIESKWALMARRIRADVQCGKPDETMILRDKIDKDAVSKTIVVKDSAAISIKTTQKHYIASTS